MDVHLVKESATGRYRFHDLIRQYARMRTNLPEPARRDAVRRLLNQYVHQVRLANSYLNPDARETPADLKPPCPVPDIGDADGAILWCETELPNLIAAIRHASEAGWRHQGSQLVTALPWFFRRRGHTSVWIDCSRIGIDMAADDTERANILRELGNAYYTAARYNDSRDVLTGALALYRRTGDLWGEGATLNNIGNTHLWTDQLIDAVDCYQQALAVRQRSGDLRGSGLTLNNLSHVYRWLNQHPESLDAGLQALDAFHRSADRRGEGMAYNNIAMLYLEMGRPTEAVVHGRQALAVAREVRDRLSESAALDTLGAIHRDLGDYQTAIDHHHRALTIAREIGHTTIAAEIQENLRQTIRAAEAER